MCIGPIGLQPSALQLKT